MVDPFAMGLAALFRSAGAVAAEYVVSATNTTLPITVIWSQGSQDAGSRSDRIVADVNSFDVQRIDVAAPARGDLITVVDRVTGLPLTFKINGSAILDVEGISWACPTEPTDEAFG